MESLVDDRTIVLGVPAYNEERHIGECLKSIQAQTFANFSVLISDNASNDGTSSICQRFAETDRRFVYFRHPLNIGAVANFRFLLDSTISPFFAWVGGHDILKPQYVETHLGILGKNSELGTSYSYFEFIDEFGNFLRSEHDVGTAAPYKFAIVRYLWSVALGADLGPMHGVFRRSFIPACHFHTCVAWDHVFQSNFLYSAPYKQFPVPLYKLRHFEESKRAQNVMQRVLGRDDGTVNVRENISAFLNDFQQIMPVNSWHRYTKPIIWLALHDRFGSPPFRLTKLLRSLAKRVHDIKRLCAGSQSSSQP